MTTTGDVPTVDVQQALSLLRSDAVLLDVRESHEWDAGHAPQAVHIPLGELAEGITSLSQQRPVVVVCRSGHRSGIATMSLLGVGVDAVNLAGGMQAWRDAGEPVTAGHGVTATII